MSLQALPIGINTLSVIREQDMVYIDKTPLVWMMARQPALPLSGVLRSVGMPRLTVLHKDTRKHKLSF